MVAEVAEVAAEVAEVAKVAKVTEVLKLFLKMMGTKKLKKIVAAPTPSWQGIQLTRLLKKKSFVMKLVQAKVAKQRVVPLPLWSR